MFYSKNRFICKAKKKKKNGVGNERNEKIWTNVTLVWIDLKKNKSKIEKIILI